MPFAEESPPHSGPGCRASGRDESPYRRNRNDTASGKGDDGFDPEVPAGFGETAPVPGASPSSGIGCPDRPRVGRIVECRLKQKGAYGLHLAPIKTLNIFYTLRSCCDTK